MTYYTLTFRDYRYRFSIAHLVDENGVVREFQAPNKRQAKRQVFDFIGNERTIISTRDPYMHSAMSLRETPMNIKVVRR